jgi:hypothetical protein
MAPQHAPEAAEDVAATPETGPTSSPAPAEKIFRNCPCCRRWTALDHDGRIGEHFYENGSCPGSGERTDITSIIETAEAVASTALVLEHLPLVESIVRALTPGNGRANLCGSEDELRQRLAEDGVEFESEQFLRALQLLEQNGDGR